MSSNQACQETSIKGKPVLRLIMHGLINHAI